MPMSTQQLEEALLRANNRKHQNELEEDARIAQTKEDIENNGITPNAGISTEAFPEDKEDSQAIILAFKEKFGGLGPAFIEPKTNEKDGSITFTFPKKGDAEQFFMEQARAGNRLIIVDKATDTVMAYSDGVKLYHADGNEFQQGDTLAPSGISKVSFEMPEPKSTFGHN